MEVGRAGRLLRGCWWRIRDHLSAQEMEEGSRQAPRAPALCQLHPEHFPCCSVAQSCPTLRPHGLQHVRWPCPSLSPQSLLKLMSIESVMPSNHLVLCLIHFLFQLEFCVVDAWGDSHGLCDWSSGLLGPQVSVRGPCGARAAPSLLSGAVQQPGQVRDMSALFWPHSQHAEP